jgi:hypothetical protein
MWLRDFLPQALPNIRIMTYGYNSKVASSSIHTFQDYSIGILEALKNARKTDEVCNRGL